MYCRVYLDLFFSHFYRVFYNSLEDICDAVRSLNPVLHNTSTSFECSCFDGHYLSPEVDAAYLQALEDSRGSGRRGACAEAAKEVHEEVAADEGEESVAARSTVNSGAENNQFHTSASMSSSMCESIYNDV